MQQVFATEQWLPFPRALVFAFFANPQNLPPLMPAWQHARIDDVTLVPPPPRPVETPSYGTPAAGNGTRLLITARMAPGLPLRLPWLALIKDFAWNERFCDVQLKGPFASWRHCHSVRDETRAGQPGAVVRDEVTYRLPLAAVSWAGAPLSPVAMRAMFRYRQRQAERLLPVFASGVHDR